MVTGTEGKRSKLETETSVSTTRSSSHEQGDRTSSRRVSTVQVDPYVMGHYRSGSSPPMGPARLPSAPLYLSKPTSPALRPLTGFNSPPTGEQYSPMSASPRSSMLHKENSYEFYPSNLGRDSRGQPDQNLPFHPPVYGHSSQFPSAMSQANAYPAYYQQSSVDLPSRRTFREPSRLPGLTHEDTTLSSDSGGAHSLGGSYPPPSAMVSNIDAQKSMRLLPQPVPSGPPTTSSLDRPFSMVSSAPHRHNEFPNSGPLAALVRASELASQADEGDAAGKEA